MTMPVAESPSVSPTIDQLSLVARYQIPDEVAQFVFSGFLVPLAENWDEKCVEFHVPSRRVVDRKRRVTSIDVYWVHPEHNVECCHFYFAVPGDLPNFWAVEDNSELGAKPIDDLDTIDDLEAWLSELAADAE